MVLIVPPAVAANARNELATPTEETAAPASPAPSSLDDFSVAGLDLQGMSAGSESPDNAPAVSPAELPQIHETFELAAVAPELAVRTAAEVFWRRVAIWSTVGGVGVFLAGALAGAAWMRATRNEPPPATDAVVENAAREEPLPVVDTTENEDESITGVENDPARGVGDDEILEDQPAEDGLAATALPPLNDASEEIDTELVAANEVEQDLPKAEPAEATESAVAAEPTKTSEPPQRSIDLLAFDPAYLDLAVGLSNTRQSPDDAGEESAKPVASFEPVEKPDAPGEVPRSAGADATLAEAEAASDGAPGLVLPDEPDESAGDVRAPMRRGPVPAETLRPADIARQLELPIADLAVSGSPLHEWLATVSDLTAVPITVEPDALMLAGVAADQPVTVETENATAGEILKETLAAKRLAYEARHGQLMIAVEGRQRRRTANYRVAELIAAGEQDAGAVARLIENLVAPESWQSRGGDGRIEVRGQSLRIEQRQEAHIRVLVLLERMLLARELPTKTRYPTKLLAIDPTYARLRPALDAKTTFTFLEWSRLADVFRYWQDTSGLNMLVDWVSLADVDLGPGSLVACSATDQPWAEVLDTLLEPLDLTWRAVDGNTIQITSRATADASRWIEFYPVADLVRRDFAGPDALIKSLSNAAGDQDAVYHYDVGSGYLLVLASGDTQRRLTKRLAAM